MSSLSQKLHSLLTRLRGGEAVLEHEVEDAIQAAIAHFAPAVEAIKADIAKTLEEAVANAKQEITTLVAEIKAELQGGTGKKGAPTADQAGDTAEAPAAGTSSDVSSTDQTV